MAAHKQPWWHHKAPPRHARGTRDRAATESLIRLLGTWEPGEWTIRGRRHARVTTRLAAMMKDLCEPRPMRRYGPAPRRVEVRERVA